VLQFVLMTTLGEGVATQIYASAVQTDEMGSIQALASTMVVHTYGQ
jgi:hypothetical protein